jgi:hypothetical protein
MSIEYPECLGTEPATQPHPGGRVTPHLHFIHRSTTVTLVGRTRKALFWQNGGVHVPHTRCPICNLTASPSHHRVLVAIR